MVVALQCMRNDSPAAAAHAHAHTHTHTHTPLHAPTACPDCMPRLPTRLHAPPACPACMPRLHAPTQHAPPACPDCPPACPDCPPAHTHACKYPCKTANSHASPPFAP
eukprot:149583-Chlamydomonas_euryale.AAC.2